MIGRRSDRGPRLPELASAGRRHPVRRFIGPPNPEDAHRALGTGRDDRHRRDGRCPGSVREQPGRPEPPDRGARYESVDRLEQWGLRWRRRRTARRRGGEDRPHRSGPGGRRRHRGGCDGVAQRRHEREPDRRDHRGRGRPRPPDHTQRRRGRRGLAQRCLGRLHQRRARFGQRRATRHHRGRPRGAGVPSVASGSRSSGFSSRSRSRPTSTGRR